MQVTRSDGNALPAATLWERPPQQRANIPGAVRGYTSHADKLVRISDGLDDINAARVLLHEAAHAVLARPGQRIHHHRAVRGQPGPPRHRGDPGRRRRLRPGRPARPGHPPRLRRLRRRLGNRRRQHHRHRGDHRRGPRHRGRHPARRQHLAAAIGLATENTRGPARPLPSRAGPRAAAQRPLPRHTGRHHPLPTTATTPYPRRPRLDRERGAAGAAPVGGCPYVANIKYGTARQEGTGHGRADGGNEHAQSVRGPRWMGRRVHYYSTPPLWSGVSTSAPMPALPPGSRLPPGPGRCAFTGASHFPDITGLIVSPPCPTFSSGGLRSALSGDDYQHALDAITCLGEGCSKTWHHLPGKVSDPRTALVRGDRPVGTAVAGRENG